MQHDGLSVRKELDRAKAAGRSALPAPESKGIRDAYGIAVPKQGVASDAGDAARLATAMGYPVVMKILSPQILHKTEAGGVVVGVKTVEQAAEAFASIVANARRYDPKASIDAGCTSPGHPLSWTFFLPWPGSASGRLESMNEICRLTHFPASARSFSAMPDGTSSSSENASSPKNE